MTNKIFILKSNFCNRFSSFYLARKIIPTIVSIMTAMAITKIGIRWFDSIGEFNVEGTTQNPETFLISLFPSQEKA